MRFPCSSHHPNRLNLSFSGLLPGLELSIPTAPRAGRRSASGRRWILGLCKIYILGELGLFQSRSGFILVGNEAAMEEERCQVDGKMVELVSLPPYLLVVLTQLFLFAETTGQMDIEGRQPQHRA